MTTPSYRHISDLRNIVGVIGIFLVQYTGLFAKNDAYFERWQVGNVTIVVYRLADTLFSKKKIAGLSSPIVTNYASG